jgi:Na+-transporting NADH:ubiquinone oxidoreductase subunit NqrB
VPARIGEIVIGAAMLIAAVFFVWQSTLLPFGNVGLPGPGFFPVVLGIALGLFALAIVIRSAREERPEGATRGQLRTMLPAPLNNGDQAAVISLGHRNALVVFAALVGVGLFFEPLGTYATLGLFTAALLFLVARTSPWRVILGASVGMVAIWAFFKVLLGVQLPTGPF